MTDRIELSSVILSGADAVRRSAPRPEALRNDRYAAEHDWHTLFYDVYRRGRHIVFQGPPFLNFLPLLAGSEPLRAMFNRFFPRIKYVGVHKRGELWWRAPHDVVHITGPLGDFRCQVQPDLSHMFAGRRVLCTISRNNQPHWIKDWIRFHVAEHKANAVLLYDNNSTQYSVAELEADLRTANPDILIYVVAWPFPYGPQGGVAGAVNGVEAPWDSNYCQTGILQHARFRMMQHARSVLHVDIDELVLSPRGLSIFEATEKSWAGCLKFAGRWISNIPSRASQGHQPSHSDFGHVDPDLPVCPPKWCVVPKRFQSLGYTWSEHNVFGARSNTRLDGRFEYRHFQAISTNWKENRSQQHPPSHRALIPDPALRAAFDRTGI